MDKIKNKRKKEKKKKSREPVVTCAYTRPFFFASESKGTLRLGRRLDGSCQYDLTVSVSESGRFGVWR